MLICRRFLLRALMTPLVVIYGPWKFWSTACNIFAVSETPIESTSAYKSNFKSMLFSSYLDI